MTSLHFLITIKLPSEPAADRVELMRDEIEQHAAAVVPFYTHQEPGRVVCCQVKRPIDVMILDEAIK